jgi:hypothetical protein
MGKLEVQELRACHIVAISDQLTLENHGRGREEVADQIIKYAFSGPAYAGVVDGAVVVCAGIQNFWDGVGQAWALMARSGLPYIPSIHRAVRDTLGALIARNGYRRIQAHIRADFHAGQRWAESLGFEAEGRMRAFARDGSDCLIYVMFPGV